MVGWRGASETIAAHARYQNFFSFDFLGFSALRFIVAVITTLTFALAPGLMLLSEIPVCSVGAGELNPRSE
jgi:hypothetical protein